ncbi:MAG TPA: L,D-transpeptidase family protein [Sphingomicrobium sp.]|jgi:murein L,D-transpeptidase YcbB/YkuD|nr:L,D-transpeptidase family protein [Sphingomicrobium sp.]
MQAKKGGGSVVQGKWSAIGILMTGAAALAVATPGFAQVAPSVPASASSSVANVYDTYHIAPIWFRNGAADPAVAQLVGILQRAPFDGFAEGPQLAAQVQAAIAQAASGNSADVIAADRIVSDAWVQYVQAALRPTPGMIYAYDVLKPHGTRTDQILLTASAAPSLQAYLQSTANLNPIYDQLRDTAWAQAQASGNMTPDPRLLANLDRLRSIPATGRYVIVDSGSQMLTMYENGQPVDSMKIVVGKPELPTPLIASIMYYIVYNPYWNVPDRIIRDHTSNQVMRLGNAYLKRQGYEVMADWTADSKVIPWTEVDWKSVRAGKTHIRIRQDPGPANSMGKFKYPFASGEDIYLHDSPEREYFTRDKRDLSHGCVRLEDAKRLGAWLLGHDPSPPDDSAENQVQLQRPVPIYLTYVTAQVKDGGIAYLDDPYGWDKAGKTQVASGK